MGLPPGPHPYLVTQVPRGLHLDLVNLVPIWASPSPGDFVLHLDLIVVDSFLASPGTGDSDRISTSPDLVTLFLTWAALVPGESVPHLSLTWTW